jgi:hypothetical protein
MPLYTVRKLLTQFANDDPHEQVIAVTWERGDFPRVWDRIVGSFTGNLDQMLINATAEVLSAHCRHELNINLRDETADVVDEREIARCDAGELTMISDVLAEATDVIQDYLDNPALVATYADVCPKIERVLAAMKALRETLDRLPPPQDA